MVFVSYSRRDNTDAQLERVEDSIVSRFGTAYLDDKHFRPNTDREESVYAALNSAEIFVAVITPSYLKTVWTSKELEIAESRGLEIYSFVPEGSLVRSSAEQIRLMQHLV